MHDRPKDPAQLADLIGRIAVGELPNDKAEILNPPPLTASQLGGRARAAALSPARRQEIARKARAARDA